MFFDQDVLLNSKSAKQIYQEIKSLPIIDYHCHLNAFEIKYDLHFANITQLWLKHDHYKWRAMRTCRIDEHYITGSATDKEKFLAFAKIMPMLCGNPLYYWCHFELKQIFGIDEPLNENNAERIFEESKNILSVRKLLKQFNVEYIATTDGPGDSLKHHGTHHGIKVVPTFRPDAYFTFDMETIKELTNSSSPTLDDLKVALANNLNRFAQKGGKLADHGFTHFPKGYLDDQKASEVFLNLNNASAQEKDGLFGNLLVSLMEMYQQRGFIVQLHFNVLRNINSNMKDSGFDTMNDQFVLKDLINFLNKIPHRPEMIFYSLNPNDLIPLINVTQTFSKTHVGPPWWFNDTKQGIEDYFSKISEYGVFGVLLGMLTDSRSYSSYVRFDFFRRLLANFLGEKVEKGEYPLLDAIILAQNISYYNIKNLLEVK